MTTTIFTAKNLGLNIDWAISRRIEYLQYVLGYNNVIIQEFLELIGNNTHGVEYNLLEMQIKGYLDKNTKIAKELHQYKNYKTSSKWENIPIERIKEIACGEIIGYAPVRVTGKNVWYLSPLRDDGRNPSFAVNLEKNTWFDFALGEGGSVIDLYMKMYNMDVNMAIRELKKLV
jgi:CHC2 zinc finger